MKRLSRVWQRPYWCPADWGMAGLGAGTAQAIDNLLACRDGRRCVLGPIAGAQGFLFYLTQNHVHDRVHGHEFCHTNYHWPRIRPIKSRHLLRDTILRPLWLRRFLGLSRRPLPPVCAGTWDSWALPCG